ncbi:possible fiber protein [Prochlorococcus marinus str. MIT 9515]|uniref:Possible fiber protein n=1 Tax=Prochlorococcus marinus (strain MIT 9515) TaxID=167542 RepID=A2BX53_PROM5|nr:hypothetical protein [Prochlorococcus marinus]ABM72364.1 possible fiber protein [Prochlorococcus marinus str. MIT 9515]|tara:strand:- start:279 stop:671 length:393 start_codon:yes stop_codon:yes gene_type:complete
MRERVFGYWTLAWAGLISNIIALPIIALIISYGPPLKVANIAIAISLGWPSAIVGIVASSALLAEKKWGITLALVSLSMIISGTIPYSIVRLVNFKDLFGIGGLTLLSALFALLALIYWCNPRHRRTIRL